MSRRKNDEADDELEDLDEELEDDYGGVRRSGRYDDDEEDDEDDEEDEDEQARPRKTRRRKLNPYLETEAAVDEDEEEDEEEAEEGYEPGLVDEREPVETDKSRYRALDSRRRQQEESISAEDLAKRFDREYREDYVAAAAHPALLDHVPQSMLIPSVSDPKLWLVRCKLGRERSTVELLMRKTASRDAPGRTPLEILTVFCRDSLPGYIYIEADKQAYVSEAIDGVPNVYGTKITLVPISDMVDCLSVKVKTIDIKPKAWVRIRRGKFEGDIARVVDIDESGDRVTLRLVPRLDIHKDTRLQPTPEQAKRKKGSDARPPQRLFQPSDFKRNDFTQHKDGYTYQKENYNREGYLIKVFRVTSLQTENVNPTLDEITRFSGGTVSERTKDLAMMATSNQVSPDDFQIGENIMIMSGELRNVPGVIQSIDNEIVTILPDKSFGLTGTFKYPIKDISKRFEEGNHVKVINGTHKDDTGLIINIENNVVTLLSDTTLQPIEVFSKDLRFSSDISSGGTSLGQYQVQDLVQLSPSEVGVVIKIEKDVLLILNQFGVVNRIRPQQIRNKRDSARAVTGDANGHPITAGDSVYLLDANSGVHASAAASSSSRKRATVLHVFRFYVFVQSREIPENSGIAVVRNSNVLAVGGKIASPSKSGVRGPTGGMGAGGGYNPYAMNGSGGSGGFGNRDGASPMGRGRGRGRDPLIAATVTISRGALKGYIGIVKDTTETHARVELHSQNRIVSVEKTSLTLSNGTNAGGMGVGMASSGMSRPFDYNNYAPRPSENGQRTPSYGTSKTPMYRSNTDSTTTPNPFGDSSRTPAWDSGSKTPAWDSGSRTPAWDSGSKTPAWDSGSKTPAWDSGSRTPAHPSYDYDDHRGSEGSYRPGTVEASAPATPFMPGTPAAGRASDYGSGSQQHPSAPTPRGFAQPVGSAMESAGSGAGQYPSMGSVPASATPATPFNPSTPFAPSTPFNPSTPYNPSTPFNPSTPADVGGNVAESGDYYSMARSSSVAKDATSSPDWITTDIEVEIVAPNSPDVPQFDHGSHNGRRCVVVSVNKSSLVAQVRLLSDAASETWTVPISCLAPVQPDKKHHFKVLSGEYAGRVGSLLSIDGKDGVAKVEGITDILMLNMVLLAKYHPKPKENS